MDIATEELSTESWIVYDRDNLDGAPDAGRQVIGHGDTADDAMADFIAQLRRLNGHPL